jgi:hypothetical protein
MTRSIVLGLAIATLVLTVRTAATVDSVAAGAEVTRKIYISAIDAKGAPVTDLTAADITVKEGGKERPVASLQPATAPMQVAILVDDRGTGAFQAGVAQFLQKGLGHGQFAITLLTPQAVKLVDFTDDATALKDALARLAQRARTQSDPDALAGTIIEAAKTLQQRKAERPVILVLTMTGGQPSQIDPEAVLTALRTTGVALNVVFGTGSDLGQIMLDGPRQSGGRGEEAGTGAAFVPAMMKIVDTLQHQYLLTYTLPDGVKMSDKIAVATSRKGISLTAPSRIPDK